MLDVKTLIHSNFFSKSNLADIFEADDLDKFGEGNPTLKYVPPKANQPQQTAEKASWNVVIAKIVGAFKLYVGQFILLFLF